jgi:hypothetical protein
LFSLCSDVAPAVIGRPIFAAATDLHLVGVGQALPARLSYRSAYGDVGGTILVLRHGEEKSQAISSRETGHDDGIAVADQPCGGALRLDTAEVAD